MAIEIIHIRAKVVFKETSLSIETPFIQSFNVNKVRNSMSNFSLSIKVHADFLDNVVGELEIYAGTDRDMPRIFTGFVKKVVPSPVWDDPAYLMLNITGTDILYRLENKKVTRRQTYSDTSWAMITGVRPGNKSSKLSFSPNEPAMIISDELLSNTMAKEGAPVNTAKRPTGGKDTTVPNTLPINAEITIVPLS